MKRVIGLGLALLVAAGGCSDDSGVGTATDTLIGVDTMVADTGVAIPTVDVPSETGGTDGSGPDVPPDVPVDSGDTDTGFAEGAFGFPCDSHDDCLSGFCIQGPDGDQCTSLCEDSCPTSWSCKAVGGRGDVRFICVYDHVPYCTPCDDAGDCDHPLTPGADNRCVALVPGEGWFCATRCTNDEACPEGASCVPTGDGANVCKPDSDLCTCSRFAVDTAASTACANSNGFGTCEGRRSCQASGLTACDAATPADDVCNGHDDDCDGATDEDFGGGAACDGVGKCGVGTKECVTEQTVMCSTDPGGSQAQDDSELCNAQDDDCDGLTDEDFAVGQACEGMGECGAGLMECSTLEIARCSTDAMGSESQASTELCDGLDNDCDGASDEDFQVGLACFGVGACGQGVYECVALDGADCSTNPGRSADASVTETCNGVDDDCDGLTDEDFGVGNGCDGGGECGAGLVECATLATTICSTAPGGSNDKSAQDLCNGKDEDCDGDTDEGFAIGTFCDAGGLCGAGTVECATLATTRCSTDPGGSQAGNDQELCDGVDNDCDSGTDEDFMIGQTCDGEGSCGLGELECAGLQATRCSTGADGSASQAMSEICDGFDNDCDGETDEGFDLGTICEGVGQCGAGVIECFGTSASGCSTDPGGSSDASVTELCSGFDEDCDGETDEGFDIDAACNGTGECGVGVIECKTTTEAHCSTDPGGSADQSVTETCDAKDNDCSGLADDNNAGCPCEVRHVLGVAYMFCGTADSWTGAREMCAAWSYQLATIESQAQNDGIVQIALPKVASPWWIGLNDRDNEGEHVWQDGSGATYRNWADGEPNDFQHGMKCGLPSTDEDCVQFSPAFVGAPPEWNDEPCACEYPYVCRQAE